MTIRDFLKRRTRRVFAAGFCGVSLDEPCEARNAVR